MQYLTLKKELKDFVVFSTLDIKKIDCNFHKQRLSEWQAKDYIKKITKDKFIFSDLAINENVLFLIANKIYSPSYISLEMAFSYYNLIPESVYGITSVTSLKTKSFKTKFGKFSYRHIKPELLFGYKLAQHGNYNYKIAEIEKVLLDFFYLNANIKTADDFYELRFNTDNFKISSDNDKLSLYLKMFGNKSLSKRINSFLEYIDYA